MTPHETEILRIIGLTKSPTPPINYSYFRKTFKGGRGVEIFKNGFDEQVIRVDVSTTKEIYLYKNGTFNVDAKYKTILEGQYNASLLRVINGHNFRSWGPWHWMFRRLTGNGEPRGD